MTVEEGLRAEKHQLAQAMDQKEKVIAIQERRIQSLDAANARLLSALNQLKERYNANPTCNGMQGPTRPKLALSENGQFKSSSC